MAKRNKDAPTWGELTDMQREHAIDFLREQARDVCGEQLANALDSLANLGEDNAPGVVRPRPRPAR